MTKSEIIKMIREKLRASKDPNLVPLGHNMTDAEIWFMWRGFQDASEWNVAN